TGRVDLLEFAACGERDEATVRRPEGPRCALRIRKRLGRQSRKLTDPQDDAAVRVVRDEGQAPAVGREGQLLEEEEAGVLVARRHKRAAIDASVNRREP